VLDQLKSRGEVKGEITLLIAKPEAQDLIPETANLSGVAQRVHEIMAKEKVDEKAALKKVAKERGISKSEAYREWQRGK
jgi:16S rRNA (cytidine1402-2'-O)-methyltransferase